VQLNWQATSAKALRAAIPASGKQLSFFTEFSLKKGEPCIVTNNSQNRLYLDYLCPSRQPLQVNRVGLIRPVFQIGMISAPTFDFVEVLGQPPSFICT